MTKIGIVSQRVPKYGLTSTNTCVYSCPTAVVKIPHCWKSHVMAHLINACAGVSSREARGVFWGLSLHRYLYFMYASSNGFGEFVHNA